MQKTIEDLPERFVERLRTIVPAERFGTVAEAFGAPRAVGFRVNTLKASAEDVVAALQEAGLHPQPVGWMPEAFWVTAGEREALLASAPFHAQAIYVQNLSSMVPPVVLAPEPGERVLDLAAAPGSKTLQMACRMRGEGELAAVELVRNRFYRLKANLAAQGAGKVRTFLRNGETVWRHRPEYFDRVLLDAPCSSEGRFHLSEPESYAYWSPRKVKEMVRKQRRLLFSAVHCLREGGTLVYSTCAFAPEENEGVLDWALGHFGDALALAPIDLSLANMQAPLGAWQGKPFAHDLSDARRILPTDTMEGFFVAHLTKTQPTAP